MNDLRKDVQLTKCEGWKQLQKPPRKKYFKEHQKCHEDAHHFIRYETSLSGTKNLIMMNGSLCIKINFCPFCGEKADLMPIPEIQKGASCE